MVGTAASATSLGKRPAVLIIDLVESVRLLQDADAEAIARWERLIALLRAQLLPRHRGQLVKSLGDGALMTFARAADALALAADLLGLSTELNTGYRSAQAMHLRFALQVTDWVAGELDIYGPGVNLCARLLGLAQPQTLVMSSDSLAALGPASAAWQVRALGNCHFKHIDAPVACVQCSLGALPAAGTLAVADLRPSLAVLPLEIAADAALPEGAAAVLRDDLVRALARHRAWQVVSRLSTQALSNAQALSDAGATAHLWLRGTLSGDPQGAVLDLSFLEGEQELWTGHYEMGWAKLLQPQGGLSERVALALDQALLRQGASTGYQPALPTVPSYALLLRALQGMHRLRTDALQQAGDMLEHLAERHPRSGDVQAWLAKWHYIRLCQVLTPDAQRTADEARQAAHKALRHEPCNGVAMALQGQLLAFHDRDGDRAYDELQLAARDAPNESLAWMYLANLQAVRGETSALHSFAQAQALSPLDPLGYELDLMGAVVHSAVGDALQALQLARRSVLRNPGHLSSQAQLIICLVEAGELAEAQALACRYIERRPQASVQRFIDHHIGGDRPIVQRQAQALLAAGLPR